VTLTGAVLVHWGGRVDTQTEIRENRRCAHTVSAGKRGNVSSKGKW
jgi:hypothetical protein